MPRPQEERGNPIGHWVKYFSIFIVFSINKKTRLGACLWYHKISGWQPFHGKQAILCLNTAPSFVLAVTGQLWD